MRLHACQCPPLLVPLNPAPERAACWLLRRASPLPSARAERQCLGNFPALRPCPPPGARPAPLGGGPAPRICDGNRHLWTTATRSRAPRAAPPVPCILGGPGGGSYALALNFRRRRVTSAYRWFAAGAPCLSMLDTNRTLAHRFIARTMALDRPSRPQLQQSHHLNHLSCTMLHERQSR